MKVKFKQLSSVLNHLACEIGTGYEGVDLEVESREEDFEGGKIQSCIVITAVYEKEASQYDAYTSNKRIKHTLEIFPEAESRPPNFVTEIVRDLVPRVK